MIRVCIAGVTGWVGKPLASALLASPDLQLVAAVARQARGERISEVTISGSVEEALATPFDVLVDYTSALAVKHNVLAAVEARRHVVIGSSGLTDEDFAYIDSAARGADVGVIAVGNFAITAALLQRFAVEAAKYLPSWEIIDYAYAGKVDSPSGMARELASRLGEVRAPDIGVPLEKTMGLVESRGATLGGSRIHSIRLPGYTIGLEVIFGRDDERLSIHYDAGPGAGPYIDGTLLAIRRVPELRGLVRGLDRIL
jgi:4-hydroxy-tetrahydrodipicolinate reductase